MAEVSFAGAAAGAGCSFNCWTLVGGVPGGVLDAIATERCQVSDIIPTTVSTSRIDLVHGSPYHQ